MQHRHPWAYICTSILILGGCALGEDTAGQRPWTSSGFPGIPDLETHGVNTTADESTGSTTTPTTTDAEPGVPFCGNGVVEAEEICDDGNMSNDDGCFNNCLANRCGDTILNPGVELCDDGNTNNEDTCLANCLANVCGDGYLDAAAEECDDGEPLAEGEDPSEMEPPVDGDGCSASCKLEGCGDGVVLAPEECDDGNEQDDDTCDHECTLEVCGDGVKQAVEDCDDGNVQDDDLCTSACKLPNCGDGFQNPGEACDGGPDCSAQCTLCPEDVAPDIFCKQQVAGLIFVSMSGSDDNLGTSKEFPVRTIAKAGFQALKCKPYCDIVVSQGDYPVSAALFPANYYGGYHPVTWERDVKKYPTSVTGSDAHGVRVTNIGMPLLLSGFKIRGKSYVDGGQSTVAMTVRDVKQGLLSISQSEIFAGNAGHGSVGTEGADGMGGAGGVSATIDLAGTGAMRTCVGGGNIDVSGGAGGSSVTNKCATNGNGGTGKGGMGDTPGGKSGASWCKCESKNGGAGAKGSAGIPGTLGSAGGGGTVVWGTWTNGSWVASPSSGGTDGKHGSGGGGGGAGASVACGAPEFLQTGKPGGGGGAGGCRGNGGTEGGAGGSSVGLALLDAWIILEDVVIHRGVAGNGGNGAGGGDGGMGGPAGFGFKNVTANNGVVPGQGGDGGAGGGGGPGGGGGGGCSGMSLGIAIVNQTTSDPDKYSADNLSFSGGSPGKPGKGGPGGQRGGIIKAANGGAGCTGELADVHTWKL